MPVRAYRALALCERKYAMPRKAVTKTEAAEVADKGDKVLINTHLDKALIAEVDEFRWSNRIEGRAETIRQLIVRGLPPENVAS
jgi:hypothetical protein